MMPVDRERPDPEALLAEYGARPRIIVYVAAAPGAGKTRRLLQDIHRLRALGRDAVIGWIEPKGRPDLERLAADLPRIPPRSVERNGRTFKDFDLAAALARKPQIIALDEIAHENLPGAELGQRWEDALALRDAGITVVCAFNIAHLESVAAIAERLTEHPLRAFVPDRFLAGADEVVALDISPKLFQSRVLSGKVVAAPDVDTALQGPFSDRTLYALRELLLRAVDQVTVPNVSAERVSTAVAFVPANIAVKPYVERAASIAGALDLRLEIRATGATERSQLEDASQSVGAELLSDAINPAAVEVDQLRASLILVPFGDAARKLSNRAQTRDMFVMDPNQTYLENRPSPDMLGGPGKYGRLTVYLGGAAGCGKTYAMLDRAQQLRVDGVDVVAALIETHGRAETAAMINGLEVLPRKIITKDSVRYEELDRSAVIARNPQVALIDELAHTNAPGSGAEKRYSDVLAILRAGIDVITTLNVQHLEALNDTVARLTKTTVRETLPDAILRLADEVLLIDATPQTLRDRLREGKIYPPERAEIALSKFFAAENLAALRELALREAIRARRYERPRAPFDRLLLCAGPRDVDVALIRRCSQFAARLGVRYSVAMITEPRDAPTPELVERLRIEAHRNHATWLRETTNNPPQRIIELAREEPETVVAVATTMRQPRWPQRNAFARRILDAGARELLVLTRR